MYIYCLSLLIINTQSKKLHYYLMFDNYKIVKNYNDLYSKHFTKFCGFNYSD